MKEIREGKYLIFDSPQKAIRYTVKKTLYPIINCLYKCFMDINCPKKCEQKKYEVSICAIFKDEGQYLKEWLEFHILVGVEHFYLYNNNSSDSYLEILQPYIERQIVTLIDWPKKLSQMEAYYDCYLNYKKDTHWMGFIDLDEYVIPNDYDTVGEFLNRFHDKRPVIVVYWKCIGSNGKIKRNPEGLIIEDFFVGWNKYTNIGKVFFNTNYEYLYAYKNNHYMHWMWAKLRGLYLPPVNVFGNTCWKRIDSVPSSRMPIQINHYAIKTYDEYVEKKSKRGGGVHDVSMHNYDYFFRHDMRCQAADFHAYKYLVKLKLALNKKD